MLKFQLFLFEKLTTKVENQRRILPVDNKHDNIKNVLYCDIVIWNVVFVFDIGLYIPGP